MALSAKSTIVIDGVDSTGKAFKSAEGNAAGLNKRLESIADKSGDSERAFLGIKDILGSMGGPVQTLADFAGGFEGILKGLGGPLGLVVAGIAALTAGMYQLYKMSEEKEKKRIDGLVAENDKRLANKKTLAETLGLETESLAGVQERLTAEQANAELQKVAAAYAKESSVRVRALAENDKERVALADQQLGKLQAQARALEAQEHFAQQIVATEQARLSLRQADADNADLERQRIERMMDVPEKLAQLESRRQAREKKLQEDRSKLREQEAKEMNWMVQKYRDASGVVMDSSAAQTKKLQEYLAEKKRIAHEELAVEDELMRIAKMGEAYKNERDAARAAANAAGKAGADAYKRRLQEQEKAEDEYTKKFVEDTMLRVKALVDEANDQKKFADAREANLREANDRILSAKLELTGDEDQKDELRRQQVAMKADQQRADLAKRIDLDAIGRSKMMQAIELEEEVSQRQISDAKKKRDEDELQRKQDNAVAIAKSTVDMLSQIGLAERAAAGLKAVIAGAESGLAFARQDYFGGVQGALAAAQFAAVAAGIGGGSSGGGAQASKTGGGQTQFGGTPMADSAAPSGGNVSINFGRGFVVGTSQQVGKAVGGALRSVKSTGYAKMEAA
jgi:hypothetical protein